MRSATLVLVIALTLAAAEVPAISPGDDLLIPGAGRTQLWVDDLYIMNPGDNTVSVELLWLERGQANPDPVSRTYEIDPGATFILPDVIRHEFGMNRAGGAFRIVADGGEVIANMIAVAVIDDENGSRTFGSGFEAVPVSAATAAGETTTLLGMVSTSRFRTNLFATSGADGAVMHLDLLDPWGGTIDTVTVSLEPWEPWFSAVTDLWSVNEFLNATASVRVESGSVVVFGSKIDNHELSQDPTTLEASFSGGAESLDGTYHFAVYDSLSYASGGNVVVDNSVVTALNGTYTNFDKTDGQGGAECPLIFLWGIGLDPTPVVNFVEGVEFIDSYPDGGEITWTVSFTIDHNLGFSGSVEAVGASFTGVDEGCNGSFPTLLIEGGKARRGSGR